MSEERTYTLDEIKALTEIVATKNTPASATLPGAQLHGPLQSGSNYGPLTYPGVKPGMFSAFQRPTSLSGYLPLVKSDVNTEIIEIMTGVTAEGGTNAAGFCGDPPGPGALKVCQQTYAFGKYYVKDDLNAAGLVGLRKNRADVPRNILNAGPSDIGNRLVPEAVFTLNDTMSQLQYEFWKVGVGIERDLCAVTWNGNAATAYTSTQHGWTTEFAGLDGQIKTGYTDAITGQACTAADSYVGTFNALVTGTDATTSRTINQFISDMVYGIKNRATKVGMRDTSWAFVMREDLFKALVEVWSCQYLTARCTTSNQSAGQVDLTGPRQMLDAMLAGQYLMVDGVQYPVIFDECITREVLGNQYYKADIYFVPLNWAGMPLTYFQYFDMDNQYSTEFTNYLNMQVERMNNGLWLVGERDTGLCFEHHFQAMMRLILETPFLAGRVDDVWYNFYAPSRDSIPGSSLYVDGGTSYRT